MLIVAAWGWLYWPLTDYLSIIFSREDFRANQILLIGVMLLIAAQIYKGGMVLQLDAPPRFTALPFALMLGGSILFLLVERYLDVNTAAASLFGLATYGLLGLWLPTHRWRSGLPAALLLIGTLPFGEHMQTFIGYPMRILTASIVRDGLAASGHTSIGIDTILVFENGISHIDIPCSGVKSLWTGSLFLLAVTWIENRRLNWHWAGTAVLFFLLLFLANLARVAILITVGEVLDLPIIANMLHVPLGVLGFIAACAAAVTLLRKQQAVSYQPSAISKNTTINNQQLTINNQPVPLPHSPFPIPHSPFTISSSFLQPALILLITIMALLYTPHPITGLTQSVPAWTFPNELMVEPLPLKPDENEWLTRDGADAADRFRFKWRNMSGSMILITSHTWRAHHRPERCFEVYGLSLDNSSTYLVNPTMPVRLVALGDGSRQTVFTATYWFQSAMQTTDDYGTRIWADLAPQRDRWILISIIFDEVTDPNSKDMTDFYVMMHETVAKQLAISN